MSESEAVFVATNVVSAIIVRFGCAGKTGALFTSMTVTTKEFVALNGGIPLSVTTVVIVFVLGPWASVGVQVITPLTSIWTPLGGFRSKYVTALAGKSGSAAVFVTTSVVCTAIARVVCAGKTGALFTSLTV